jgi:hypothetical protein
MVVGTKNMVVRTKTRIVGTNLWLWEHNNYVCGNKDLGLLAQSYGCGKQKKNMVVGRKTYGCGNKIIGCGNKNLWMWEQTPIFWQQNI